LTIEPTVRSSARSSKGRLFECQRSLTRMTSTVKVEGLRREIVNRDESAWGDTKPKSSNRAKTAWLMARRGAPRGGFKPRPLGCSTVPAPERDQRCSDTSGTRGTGGRRRRRCGDGMTTPRVLSTAAPNLRRPSVDGMASRESGVIAWRHRFRRRRARLAPSSRPILLWPLVTSPIKRSFTVANSETNRETNKRETKEKLDGRSP